MSQGQLHTGSPASLNNFCRHHTFRIKTIPTEICLTDPSSVPRGLTSLQRCQFFACPSTRQQRWSKNLQPHRTKKKNLGSDFQLAQMGFCLVFDGALSILLHGSPCLGYDTFDIYTNNRATLHPHRSSRKPQTTHCCVSRDLHLQANTKYHPAALQTHRTATAPLQLTSWTRRGTGGAM